MSDDIVNRAYFVPRNGAGQYNCSVEIIRSGESGCLIYLRPEPGGSYVDEENFLMLLDVDDKRKKTLPVWVGKTMIVKAHIPDYQIEFLKNRRPSSFNEAVAFMSSFSAFKRA